MPPRPESPSAETAVAQTAVREQLERILLSEAFSRSERLSRFLRFVVEQTLAGNGATLKEQVLASELYGRGPDFSSATDPIVRVDARRLRDKLREYYSDCREEPLVIELPKGAYVPVFKLRMQQPPPAVPPPSTPTPRRAMWALLGIAAAVLLAALLIGSGLLRRTAVPRFDKINVRRITETGDVRIAVTSPDGRRLAIVSGDPGERSLHIRDADGRNIDVIVQPGPDHFLGATFSPDGSEIFYVARRPDQTTGTLYATRATGGVPQVVKSRIDSPVSFSPDGSRIAFVREYPERRETVLYVCNRDGSAEQSLHSRKLPEYIDYPAWSPDGKTIACTLRNVRDRDAGVLLINTAGNQASELGARRWRLLQSLAWMRDGQHLVTAGRALDGRVSPIWMINAGDGSARAITGAVDEYYRVSVAGDRILAIKFWLSKRLMFTESRPTGQVPAGNRWRTLTEAVGTSAGAGPREVSWTPDGRVITADRQLFLSGRNGLRDVQLTRSGVNDNPSACGDGRHIVYTSEHQGRTELWRIDSDGSDPTRLVAENLFGAPDCSADGRWVAYTAVGSEGWTVLWRVPIEGGPPVQLNSDVARKPAISPDGSRIAVYFAYQLEGEQTEPSKIAIIPANGNRPVRVFTLPSTVDRRVELRWTPDGRGIAFVDERGGASNIWTLSLDKSPPRQLSNFTSGRVLGFNWSRNGGQLAVSLGGMPHDLVVIESAR
jgi:eukaryotic-like serine/threonine-protein kinase